MKLDEVLVGSDISIEMLDYILTSLVKYGWTKDEIVGYVNDSLDLKIEEKAS